jgi:hypothetical protein
MCPFDKSTQLRRKKTQIACKDCLKDLARVPSLSEFENKAETVPAQARQTSESPSTMDALAQMKFMQIQMAALQAQIAAGQHPPVPGVPDYQQRPPSPKREREEEANGHPTKHVRKLPTDYDDYSGRT